MGYNHFRYARRIDGDAIALYLNDMTKLLEIDRDTANTITVKSGGLAGKHLTLKANMADAYPFIRMSGGGRIGYNTNTLHEFQKQSLSIAQLTNVSNTTTLEGGGVTGDDLKLKANTLDARPFILQYGNGGILADITASSSFEFANGGSAIANIAVGGGASGGALKLKETTTPTATADYGAIYTKADNHLYWQSGAGVEYDLGGA